MKILRRAAEFSYTAQAQPNTEIASTQIELRALLEHAGRNSQRTRLHRVFANELLKI